MYNEAVASEWEANKADDNYRKHGVRFSTEALGVFEDEFALTITDDESDPAEQRFIPVGMGTNGWLLVFVYTYRGDNIRVISA